MIQEIAENFDNRFLNVIPDKDDYVICFRDNKILFSLENNGIIYPIVSEINDIGAYLFEVGGKRFFLGNADDFKAYKYFDISLLRTVSPKEAAFAGITAYQLYNWYRNNRFCGRCGKIMHHSKTERAMICSCGNTVYPKICPAYA